MASLFEISDNYMYLLKVLEDLMTETEGEITEDAEAALKSLEATEKDAKDKIEAYYYFIVEKQGANSLIDDEINRLQLKKQANEKLIERLKKYTNTALELFGEVGKTGNRKIKTDKLSVWNVYHKPLILEDDFYNEEYMNFNIKKNFNADEIKGIKEYLNQKGIEIELNSSPKRTEIKEALIAGKEIKDARIDNTASYVRFK